jgi:hypothetical protein
MTSTSVGRRKEAIALLTEALRHGRSGTGELPPELGFAHQISGRRGTAGPDEVQPHRAAAGQWVRRIAVTPDDHPSTGHRPRPRGRRSCERVVQGDERAGRGEKVVGGAGQVPNHRPAAESELTAACRSAAAGGESRRGGAVEIPC